MTYQRDPASGRIAGIGAAGPEGNLPATSKNFDPITGFLTSETDRAGLVTTYTYDAAGRMITRVQGTGSAAITQRFAYDAAGRVIAEIDGRGQETSYAYDSKGRRVSMTAPPDTVNGLRAVTSYAYDDAGRLETVTDPQGRMTSFSYDARGRQVKTTYADGTFESKVYRNGFLMETYDRVGTKTSFSYDGAGRKSTETVIGPQDSSPVLVRSWSYRPGTEEIASETENGVTLSKTFDAYGHPLSETRVVRPSESLTSTTAYDAIDRPWRIVDERGRRTWTVYDIGDRVIRTVVEQIPGAVTTIPDDAITARSVLLELARPATDNPGFLIQDTQFDGAGNVVARQDALGVRSTYTYDVFGRLVAQVIADRLANGQVNPQAARTEFQYDAAGNQTRVIHPRSFVRQASGAFVAASSGVVADAMTYTGRNLVATKTVAVGTSVAATTAMTYTLTGKILTVSDPRNATWLTTFAYGVCCDRLTQVQDALGFVTSFGYDANGQRTSITDPNLAVSTTAFDALGRMVAQVNGRGDTTTIRYDRDLTDGFGLEDEVPALILGLDLGPEMPGTARCVTDPTGVKQYEVYDGIGRVIRRMDGAGRATTITYGLSVDGLETETVTDALGHATVTARDARGLIRWQRDALGATATMAWDGAGRLVRQQDANGIAATSTYDAAGRPTATTDILAKTASFTYAPDGLVLTKTDGLGGTTTWTYDARGRKVSERDRVGGTTLFGYDAAGNLTRITDAEGGVTTYAYSRRQEITSETFPGASGGTRTYTYDAGGRLKTRKDQRAITTTYTYDAASQMTKRSYSTGVSDTFTYDGAGRLLTALSSRYGTTITREYEAGELASESQRRNDGQVSTVTYLRDGAARLTSQSLQDGTVWNYTVNGRGQRTGASLNGSSVFGRSFDTGGRLTQVDFANGLREVRTYDRLQVASQRLSGGMAVADPLQVSYVYDANRRKISELASHVDGDAQGFTYDAADRVTAWSRTPGALGEVPPASDGQTWTLSKVGDWQSTTINGVTQGRTHSAVHEVTSVGSVSLTYDAAGNLTRDERGQTFVWDEENRLQSGIITDPSERRAGPLAMSYDALGRRLTRQVYNRRTDYVLDGAQVLQERDRRVTATTSQTASDGVLAPESDPAPLGSVLLTAGARHLNFQPVNEVIPTGWIADKGRTFGVRTHGLSYGWSTALTTSQMAVRQASPAPELDTQHLPTSTQVWRYQVPANGTYAVVVVAGDPSTLTRTNHLVLNGQRLADPDPAPSSPSGYASGDFDGWAQTVTVTDGFITLTSASDAVKPALCFIEIGPVNSTVSTADQERLVALVNEATNRTTRPPYPAPVPTPRTLVYDGDYVDAPLMLLAGSGTSAKRYFLHANHLYSPLVVTDATGKVVERYTYSAYGHRTVLGANGEVLAKSGIGQERGFTGYVLDEASGQYYARARMYSAGLGRFTNRDPAGYVDGFGLYSGYFVPNAVDPSGRIVWIPVILTGVAGGLIVKGIIDMIANLNYFKAGVDIQYVTGNPNAALDALGDLTMDSYVGNGPPAGGGKGTPNNKINDAAKSIDIVDETVVDPLIIQMQSCESK